MKYKEWLDEWLEAYIKPNLKTMTIERYRQLIETHINRELGERQLDTLTTIEVQKFVATLSNKRNGAKTLAPSTINIIISILNGSLEQAYAVGYVNTRITKTIARPKQKEKKIECFSVVEQKKIEDYINAANRAKYIGILICLYTGIRIGELMALTWQDIDMDEKLLSVSKTCHDESDFNGYKKVIESPKTESSNRIIPIPKQLISVLNRAKKHNVSGFVVEGKGKSGIAVRSYQRTFSLLLKKLNIAHRGVSLSATYFCNASIGMRNGRKNTFGNFRALQSYRYVKTVRTQHART